MERAWQQPAHLFSNGHWSRSWSSQIGSVVFSTKPVPEPYWWDVDEALLIMLESSLVPLLMTVRGSASLASRKIMPSEAVWLLALDAYTAREQTATDYC